MLLWPTSCLALHKPAPMYSYTRFVKKNDRTYYSEKQYQLCLHTMQQVVQYNKRVTSGKTDIVAVIQDNIHWSTELGFVWWRLFISHLVTNCLRRFIHCLFILHTPDVRDRCSSILSISLSSSLSSLRDVIVEITFLSRASLDDIYTFLSWENQHFSHVSVAIRTVYVFSSLYLPYQFVLVTVTRAPRGQHPTSHALRNMDFCVTRFLSHQLQHV